MRIFCKDICEDITINLETARCLEEIPDSFIFEFFISRHEKNQIDKNENSHSAQIIKVNFTY